MHVPVNYGLPVTHASYDDFKKDLTFAFLNIKGYGYA